MWGVAVDGRNVLGEGSVSTGGIWNPAVAGAHVADAGGVGSWVGLAPATASKVGDWEGVRRRERWSSTEEGSHAEMEGRRGAGKEELGVATSWK